MLSNIAEAPYISVIASLRGGAAGEEFVAAWRAQATQYSLSSEVKVVELGQRNSAIREARGEFVLSTYTDIRFAEAVVRFLAERRLERNRLYRMDCQEGDWLHAREGSFRLAADGLRRNFEPDIAALDSGIHFGEGWFPPEQDGEVFRWMGLAGEVLLRVPAGGAALEMEIEPGPGVDAPPHILNVLDDLGAQIGEFAIRGRTTVRLWVPETARGIRLVPAGGGGGLLDDLRILNLRCFRCAWVAPAGERAAARDLGSMRPTLLRQLRGGGLRALPTMRMLRAVGNDIFGTGIEYWGMGWHRLETSATEKFHWVSNDAELVVRVGAAQQDLCLVAESGPSLQRQPFELSVRLADGAIIGRARIKSVRPVRIALPLAPGSVAKLFLTSDRTGEALPGDYRVLNFRVLACACETSAEPVAAVPPLRQWTTVTVREQPAAIDWAELLAGAHAQLKEIGKPAFLHVNACDAVLMHRRHWFDLRGYPELGEPPEYQDALLCYTAHFAGVQEEVLPPPLRITRAPQQRRQEPLDDELIWLITQMRRLRTPVLTNVEGWRDGE